MSVHIHTQREEQIDSDGWRENERDTVTANIYICVFNNYMSTTN